MSQTAATTARTRRGRRQSHPVPATPDLLGQRLFLRVREYSDLTGTPLPTVYALIAAGKIEGVVRIGNSIRIPVAAIKGLVAA
ncbi:MAG: excisionase family DNA-binding protein [Bryobacteraceae bacterium]